MPQVSDATKLATLLATLACYRKDKGGRIASHGHHIASDGSTSR
jgi:hypothetical protein